jgi:hypothetical protein
MNHAVIPEGIARFLYYSRHIAAHLLPRSFYREQFPGILNTVLSPADEAAVADRVRYCNRVSGPFDLDESARPFRLRAFKGKSAYQMDLQAIMRYFDPGLRVGYRFGDIQTVPTKPMLVKSRPIGDDNENAILFKLNSIRHFTFVNDSTPFARKKDKLVWRGRAVQPRRQAFLEKFFNHPLCDVGHYHPRHDDFPLKKNKLSIGRQLQYKFVLAIEGNDVASNLKWILSSNSLCFMARPRFETWFMEGRLRAGFHYVELRDDYADLPDKIEHFLAHPEEALEIIRNANAWVAPFRRARMERVIGMRVLLKYFQDSGQMDALRWRNPVEFGSVPRI